MKNLFQIIGLIILTSFLKVQGQGCNGTIEYITENITATVSINGCTRQWEITAIPSEHPIAPTCDAVFGCYQYDLFKNSTHIQQGFTSTTYTFPIDYNQPGSYQIVITAKYFSRNNCSGTWVIVMDYSQGVNLTSFCIPNITYSNVNSADASLPANTSTTNFIQTQNTVTVNTNSTVSFYSQGTITLSPGFTAQSGSVFNASFQACTANATCQQRTSLTDESPEETIREEKYFSVYPNPASDHISIITGDLNQHTGSIYIYNASGEKIMTLENNSTLQPMYEINTNTLPNGLYIIKISEEYKEYNKKVIILK